MKKYGVYKTDEFNKEFDKLSNDGTNRIENMFNQLTINPYVGDQLQIRSLREKRLNEKRIYYLVFEDLQSILMIAMSDKKDQQKMINFIVDNINVYREYLRNKLGI